MGFLITGCFLLTFSAEHQQHRCKHSRSHVHHEYNHGQKQEAEAQAGGVGWKHPVGMGCPMLPCVLLRGAGTLQESAHVSAAPPVPSSWPSLMEKGHGAANCLLPHL